MPCIHTVMKRWTNYDENTTIREMIVISEHVQKSDIGLGLQIMCFTSQPILHLLCVYMSFWLFIRLHVIFAMYKFRHHKHKIKIILKIITCKIVCSGLLLIFFPIVNFLFLTESVMVKLFKYFLFTTQPLTLWLKFSYDVVLPEQKVVLKKIILES